MENDFSMNEITPLLNYKDNKTQAGKGISPGNNMLYKRN